MDKNLFALKNFLNENIDQFDFIQTNTINNASSFFKNIFDKLPFVIYVMDIKNIEIHFVSNEIENLIGYSIEELKVFKNNFLDLIHPLDSKTISSIDYQKVIDEIKSLKNIRISKNYRLIHKNGMNIKCLDQSIFFDEEEKNESIIVLGILIDITSFKCDDEVFISITEINNNTGEESKLISPEEAISKFNITKREFEIIDLLSKGAKSQDIANFYDISLNTVNKHRRNILLKFNCKNVKELLSNLRKKRII
jgi:PAS domain S-box-containing protein